MQLAGKTVLCGFRMKHLQSLERAFSCIMCNLLMLAAVVARHNMYQ